MRPWLLPVLAALGCAPEAVPSPSPTPRPGDDVVATCDDGFGTAEGDCAADFSLDGPDGVFTLSDTAGDRVVLVGAAAW